MISSGALEATGALLDGPLREIELFSDMQRDAAKATGASVLEQKLVSAGLRNAMLLQLRVGWRPVEELGLLVWGGYGIGLAMSGAFTDSELERAAGSPLPTPSNDMFAGMESRAQVTSTFHIAQLMIGWKHQTERMFVRVGAGYVVTFAASSSASIVWADRAFEQAVARRVENSLVDHFRAPVASLTLGYYLLQ